MLHAYFAGRLILLSLFLFTCSYANQQDETSCLDLRENCRNSLSCRSALRSLGDCGNGLQGCLRNSSEVCLASLNRVRNTFGLNSTCSCNVRKDKFDECIKFRTKIWQNPCETAFVEEIQQIETTPTSSRKSTRIVRSPNSEQIQRWKKEFSQEIKPNPATLSTTSCTNALFELCLKHISCRELWKLFRQECAIDAQNNCLMTNRNDCWQSFEGISWTGLGNCTCQTNNSDCHWIRLQTNYNKCIYEITSSGELPRTISVKVPLPNVQTTPVIPYWATSSPTTLTHQSQTRDYTYQSQSYSPATWTTQTPQQTVSLQHEEYQREFARRENERREYEKRLREYEEQRRQWQTQYQTRQQPEHTATTQSPAITQLTTTSKPYLRAIYSSTTPQSSSTISETGKTYRVNGTPYYRRNFTQTTSAPEITTTTSTQAPKTTRKPKTTTTSTTSTTAEPSTTIEIQTATEKPSKQSETARLPIHYAHRKQTTTTTAEPTSSQTLETTKSVETTKSSESKQGEKSGSKEESRQTNIDEEKLQRFSLEQRTRGDTVEELKDYGVLVNRWQPPTNKSDDAESTCEKAHEKCDTDETCRWHLSELQMKCQTSENCQRTQCAAAMRRFSRYVNKSILESMMFCQCSFIDTDCKHQQALMFPRCLYDLGNVKPKWSCTQTVKLCQHDSYCSRSLNGLNNSCPLSSGPAGGCVAKDLGECRLALLGVRGTDLESPCYCNKDDEKCMEFQNMVLPNNPCVEDAMLDFVASGSIATASDRELPKSKSKTHSSTRRNQKKTKESVKSTTSTTTTSTTPEPSPEENETEPDEKESVSTEDTSAGELDETEIQATDNTTSKSTEKKPETTIATEIRTKVPTKGIKVSTKPGTSTAKVVSGQPMVTQTPPPKEGGCRTRNIEGNWITHYKNSVFRQYNDLSGRCSSFCECSASEKTTCTPLTCLPESICTTPNTKVVFGERLFIEGRGACLCHSQNQFICDSSEDVIELDPGIYISLGFSRDELKLLKEKVPKPLLEKCGLVSPDISVQNDIASRLQFALERVLPKEMLCRLALIERYSRENVILLQIQWYGIDKYSNTTKGAHWHVGKLEKVCAPYVRKLESQFSLEKAARYQLVLSTVKQLRVYDLLDGLAPISNAAISLFHCPSYSLILSLLLLLIAKAQLNEQRPHS